VALSAGTTYWFVVKLSSIGFNASNYYQVGHATSDVYASHVMAYGNTSSSPTWTAQGAGTGDLAFLLYTSEDSPERLRYDRVPILADTAPRAVGLTLGAPVDLGEAPPERIEVTLEAGAGTADPAGTVAATISGSWDYDPASGEGTWEPVSDAGPFDGKTTDTVGVPSPPRWLRADTAVASASSVSGISGIEAAPEEGD
jgi:hypothetical protein